MTRAEMALGLTGLAVCLAFGGAAQAKEEQAERVEVKLQRQWGGQGSGYGEPASFVAKSAEEWQKRWSQMFDQPVPDGSTAPAVIHKPPVVDFKRSMAIAVFQGKQPSSGYAVEIRRVFRTKDELVAEVVESRPSPTAKVEQTPTSPYQVVIVEHSELPVRFFVVGSEKGTP